MSDEKANPIDIYSVEALCFYLYNRSAIQVVIDVFDDPPGSLAPQYASEKVKLLYEEGHGIQSLWARLDNEHKRRLLDAARNYMYSRGFNPYESMRKQEP